MHRSGALLIECGYYADGNHIVSDHLGSPCLVIDAHTGEIAQQMDYDEF